MKPFSKATRTKAKGDSQLFYDLKDWLGLALAHVRLQMDEFKIEKPRIVKAA